MRINYILTAHDEQGQQLFSPTDTYSAGKIIEAIREMEAWRERQPETYRLPEDEELTDTEAIQQEIDSHVHPLPNPFPSETEVADMLGIVATPHTDTPD